MTETTATANQATIPAEPHIRFYRDYRVYASWIVAWTIFFAFNGYLGPLIWGYIGSTLFFEWLLFDVLRIRESSLFQKRDLSIYNGFPPEAFDRYATFSKWARRGCFLFALTIVSIFQDSFDHFHQLEDLFWATYGLSFLMITYAVTHCKVVVCPFKPKVRFMREYPAGYVPPPKHVFPEFDPLAKYNTIYGYYENCCMQEISRGY